MVIVGIDILELCLKHVNILLSPLPINNPKIHVNMAFFVNYLSGLCQRLAI